MPLKMTEVIDFTSSEQKAARKRAADVPHVTFEEKELDGLQSRVVQRKNLLEAQRSVNPGAVVNSSSEVTFIKNAKYQAALMADKTKILAETIYQSSKDSLSVIQGIERATQALSSDVKEYELEYLNSYSKVHYNGFIRHIDMDEDFDILKVRRDPKTTIPFLATSVCEVVPATGITFPILNEEEVSFVRSSLVSEYTDRGDTYIPLLQSDPQNVLLNDEVFRYSIVKKEFDNTSKAYTSTSARCALQLEVSGLQLINTLVVEPAASSSIFLTGLVGVSDTGEEIDLGVTSIELTRRITLLLEPLRFRYLVFKFEQYAPVERTKVLVNNTTSVKFNEFVQSLGLTPSEIEDQETIEGAVYDFSIASIKGYFRTYNDVGIFSSNEVRSSNLIGFSLDLNEGLVYGPRSDQYKYGLISDPLYTEAYVWLEMKGKNKETITESLIPMRDGAVQAELLPLFGKESRLKFYPDIYRDLSKVLATAVYSGGVWVVTIATTLSGLSDKTTGIFYTDDDLRFMGPDGSELVQGPASYTKISSTEIHVQPFGSGNRDEITASTLPYLYVYFASQQTSSIVVSDSTDALTLGMHYQLSFDSGSTWVDEIPWGQVLPGNEQAGTVCVRFINPDYNETYRVQYPILKTQWLDAAHTIRLRNYRVTVSPENKYNICSLRTIIILRGYQTDPYLTGLVDHYSLNLRELNVS